MSPNRLATLLASLFTSYELVRFLRTHDRTPRVVGLLAAEPGQLPPEEFADQAAQALDRLGLIDYRLRDDLIAERTEREAEIREAFGSMADEPPPGPVLDEGELRVPTLRRWFGEKPTALPRRVLVGNAMVHGDRVDVVWTIRGEDVEWAPRSRRVLDAALADVGHRAVLDDLADRVEASADVLQRVGAVLFTWLFGDRDEHARLFNRLFQTTGHTGAVREPVRLRLDLHDGGLARLPWRLLYDRGWLVESGWTVEQGLAAATEGVTLPNPCSVVLVIPGHLEGARHHERAIRHRLSRWWGDELLDVQVVRTKEALEALLDRRRPALLYLWATAHDDHGEPVICLDYPGTLATAAATACVGSPSGSTPATRASPTSTCWMARRRSPARRCRSGFRV